MTPLLKSFSRSKIILSDTISFHNLLFILWYKQVHADVRIGEEIRLSGNAPVLGCDDPARAVPLVTSPGDFPWWHTKEGIINTCCKLVNDIGFKLSNNHFL